MAEDVTEGAVHGFLEQLCASGMVFKDGRINLLSQDHPGGEPFILADGTRFTLVDGPSFECLAEFDLNNFKKIKSDAQELEVFGEAVESALFELLPQALVLSGVEAELLDRKSLTDLFLKNLKLKPADVLQEPAPERRSRPAILDIESALEKIFPRGRKGPVDEMVDSFFGVTDEPAEKGAPLLFWNGELLRLLRNPRGGIICEGKKYIGTPMTNVRGDVLRVFAEYVDGFAREKFQECYEKYAGARDVSGDLVRYLVAAGNREKVDLDFKKCGLSINRSAAEFYLRVDPFILSDFHGGYYAIPKTTISVDIRAAGEISAPHIKGTYSHPFVWEGGRICSKATGYGREWNRKLESVIANMLHAKKILESAYVRHDTDENSYSLTRNGDYDKQRFFNRVRMSRDEARRSKVRITNELRQDETGQD